MLLADAASFLAYWIVASVLFEAVNGINDTAIVKLYSLAHKWYIGRGEPLFKGHCENLK